MKRAYTVRVPGYRPFTMILDELGSVADAQAVVRSIWPEGRVE